METIEQLLERKYQIAKDAVLHAYQEKERVVAEADSKIAAAIARRDTIDNLRDLDWKLYAKNTLESE